ncbi:MAG: SF1B family DNA helicase RecD2, partial [Anaerolineae bacterium]
IEETPHRLREVPGIGKKRTERITHAWEEQKQIKEIMLFLQGHGVSTGLAVKIYKKYGDEAITIVRSDPYRLAKDIWGIGFKTADKIARELGIAADAPERLQAGLRYVLGTFSDDGHCFATQEALIAAASELLEVGQEACEVQLDILIRMEELIVDEEAIYLPPFFYAELGVANKIRQLLGHPRDRLALFREVDWEAAFGWLDGRQAFKLADQQREAVRMALTEKVSILTGGPGTGKTTITRSIIQLLRAKKKKVLLAAPTGRAAKRLSEATGLGAKTLHRLLEFSPGAGNLFLRDQENPLDADMVIVDEASMMDVLLTNHLLKALEAGLHLLLVGDVDQLPSVGPGSILRDLINSGEIPVTRLETIFRQSEESYIVVNAHRINQGQMPIFEGARDFYLFRMADAEEAADWILDIVAERIPRNFSYDPDTEIQVLSPMHRGAAGVGTLNGRLQERLNPPAEGKAEYSTGRRVFRVGDRVMQIRNDYDRQVFNGDMGRIVDIDLEQSLLVVDFEGVGVGYEFTQLDELVHAYAVSIHKSQGSEFPAVVVPILTQHYVMLQRNLLYTAVTRAQELVVLVGNYRAIAIAVHNDKISQRNTKLAERLRKDEG